METFEAQKAFGPAWFIIPAEYFLPLFSPSFGLLLCLWRSSTDDRVYGVFLSASVPVSPAFIAALEAVALLSPIFSFLMAWLSWEK